MKIDRWTTQKQCGRRILYICHIIVPGVRDQVQGTLALIEESALLRMSQHLQCARYLRFQQGIDSARTVHHLAGRIYLHLDDIDDTRPTGDQGRYK